MATYNTAWQRWKKRDYFMYFFVSRRRRKQIQFRDLTHKPSCWEFTWNIHPLIAFFRLSHFFDAVDGEKIKRKSVWKNLSRYFTVKDIKLNFPCLSTLSLTKLPFTEWVHFYPSLAIESWFFSSKRKKRGRKNWKITMEERKWKFHFSSPQIENFLCFTFFSLLRSFVEARKKEN